MTTMNISLPDEMRSFVEEQVAQGGYSTASEYFRSLVREAQEKKAARERIESLLLEGLGSGESSPMTPEDWEAVRSAARRVLTKRGKK